MARRKKHVEPEEHENHERWLVSYADMVTLLMALFIVLFAMATVDANKFTALKESLAGEGQPSPSVLEGNQSVIDGGELAKLDSASSPNPKIDSPEQNTAAAAALAAQQERSLAQQRDLDNLEQAKEEIQAALDEAGMGDKVRFRKEPRGLVVTVVSDQVLFDSARAEVKPDGQRILQAVAPPLKRLPNAVTVEGHTDDRPINSSQFPSNWELSTARATSVLRFLTEKEGMPASRLSAAGYADQRPVVPNDSSEHRTQNRRVEIVVQTMPDTSAAAVDTESQQPRITASDLPSLPPRPVADLPQVNISQNKETEH